tara:strand:+ start:780 stop:977 length:198 start_codon:yes stop_codon:yes gene_type:complete
MIKWFKRFWCEHEYGDLKRVDLNWDSTDGVYVEKQIQRCVKCNKGNVVYEVVWFARGCPEYEEIT